MREACRFTFTCVIHADLIVTWFALAEPTILVGGGVRARAVLESQSHFAGPAALRRAIPKTPVSVR
ncbi:hypothetical protein DPMN_186493 [Dreissena polymorpha]|uniref:Uncharacterized protein n=1 Tax=Dreissena polymorpha TaxID=45954 RepID=A0A9D4DMN5_DREPO|nr:hypothetical protein DPMN_186493 [Dreissena polymorpha]